MHVTALAIRVGVVCLVLAVQPIAVAAAGQPASATDARPTLTLHKAIAEALSNSPALQAPQDAATVAEIQRRVAESRFGFKITPAFSNVSESNGLARHSLGVAVSKRLPIGTELSVHVNSLKIGSGPGEFRDAGYTVGLSQSILRGFGPASRFELTNAARAIVTAERSLVEARQQLVLAVAEAYFVIVGEQRLVEAGERALARAFKLRRASEARASVGLATQLDVLRADLLASQAEASLTLQRESLASAADRLKILLGRPPDDLIAIAGGENLEEDPAGRASSAPTTTTTTTTTTTDTSIGELVVVALASRPDAREARDRIDDARRRAAVARWNLFPDVNVEVSYTRRGLGAPGGSLFNDLFGGWRLGVSTSHALDRAAETAAAETSEISLRAAQRAALETDRQIATEVRRAHRAWLRAAESIAIQQKALDLAQKQLRLAELRYERGLADNFDVIDAESNAFQAQTALIAAQVDHRLSALALERATGTLDPNRYLK